MGESFSMVKPEISDDPNDGIPITADVFGHFMEATCTKYQENW